MSLPRSPHPQLFYKRLVAGHLFGGVKGLEFYPVFNLIVIGSALLLHRIIVSNKAVGEVSKAVVKRMAGWVG